MELEKRGWECVTPIHAVSTTYFKQLDNGAFTDKFSHNKEKYRAIYEKVRNV